jgi:hypothetical protein
MAITPSVIVPKHMPPFSLAEKESTPRWSLAAANLTGSLYLHSIDGKDLTEEDARDILLGCGDLEKLWHASDTDMQVYHLPKGIWVTFAYYKDARDAQGVSAPVPHVDPANLSALQGPSQVPSRPV